MITIKSANAVIKFTDYQQQKKSIPLNNTDIFTFDSFSLKPRRISFLPKVPNLTRAGEKLVKNRLASINSIASAIIEKPSGKIGVPVVPPIAVSSSNKSFSQDSQGNTTLPTISESAISTSGPKMTVSSPSSSTATDSPSKGDAIFKATVKATIAGRELKKADSDESVEEHAYISYSYIEAKKAHARSAHIQEDRPTRLRKFMHLGSLARNYTATEEIIWGDTHTFTAVEKWKFAIETIIKLLKSFHHSSSIYEYDSYQDADTMYELFKYHQEVSLSTKIHHYFKKQKKGSITDVERYRLDHLLCERIPLFAKLSYEQKVRLCQYVKYEHHKKGTHLFTQGAEAGYVYYILNGQIQLISKNIENAEILVDHVNVGSVISPDNADGTWQEHTLRLSSAFLNADSDLLSFDRRDYWSILKGEATLYDQDNRVQLLKSLSTFSKEDDVLLEQAAPKTNLKYFPKDFKIVNQGQTNKFIHWIISGEVRVDRTTPFIAKIDSRNTVRPDTSNNHISPKEKRIEETLMIGCLQRDDSFPEPFPETIPTIGVAFDRLDLITKIADHEALGLDKSTVSVTTISPVVCVVIQRIDFCRVMSMEMYRSLHNESSIYFIKPKPLQIEWISRVEWKKQKHSVVRSILADVRSSKEKQKQYLQDWMNKNGSA